MMSENSIEQKIRDLFGGIIKSIKRFEDPKYESGQIVSVETMVRMVHGKIYKTTVDEKKLSSLIYLFNKLYPEKVDEKFIGMCVYNLMREWVELGLESSNEEMIDTYVVKLHDVIQEEIMERSVYLPIIGLNARLTRPLDLGLCSLHSNDTASELRYLLEVSPHLAEIEIAETIACKAFIKCVLVGQKDIVMKRSELYSQVSLDILRFYLGSYYRDEYRGMGRQMDILGNFQNLSISALYWTEGKEPAGDIQRGGSFSQRPKHEFEINDEIVDSMNKSGLQSLHNHIKNVLMDNGDDLSWRLYRSIEWFSKATKTKKMADSFLYLAISVEALLSEDRTPQETYAIQISALITRGTKSGKYFLDGDVWTEFINKLEATTDISDAFNIVRAQVIDLFSLRNRIAHGKLREKELEAKLLVTFETLVRSAILSFLDGGWSSLKDFKEWVHKRIDYRFTL